MKKDKSIEDAFLTKLPVLGFLFRRIKENRQAIKTTLKTGKITEDKIKQEHFILGLIRIDSQKTFSTLNFKKAKWGEKN